MVKYKVIYFNLKGLGESVRMTLSYLGHDFEDHRIEYASWPELKKTTPFGRLPALEVDGKIVAQSSAICRYLANGTDLAGKNAWENLQIDMVVGAIHDLIGEILPIFRENDPKLKEEKRNKCVKETLPFYMAQFESCMDKNKGYLANSRLSWADIFLVGYAENFERITEDPKILDSYPKLKALMEKVHSEPNIKKWIAKRP